LSTISLLAALTAATSSGCFSRTVIPATELPKLNGFDSTQPSATPFVVQADDGSPIDFSQNPNLTLETPQGEVGGDFGQIRVVSGTLEGRTTDGEPVQVSLNDVVQAHSDDLSPGLTIAAVAIAVVIGSTGYSLYEWGSCTQNCPH
jgi:hypothetical protein